MEHQVRQREPVTGGGWYPDPFEVAAERWWDGTKWTQAVRGTAEAGAVPDESTAPAGPRGMPPGWYPWRGDVWRWWDGQRWREATKPVAGRARPGAATREQRRWRLRALYLFVGLLALVAIGLAIGLTGASSPPTYRARVGALCTRTFAQHSADVSRLGGPPGSAVRHSQTAFAGRLFAALIHESAAFDGELQAIVPPPGLRRAQERYLRLDREDDALYAPVVRRLERRMGAQDLTAIQRRVTRHELAVRGLLKQLGGVQCSTHSPGLG